MTPPPSPTPPAPSEPPGDHGAIDADLTAALAAFSAEREVLIASDFDGTLSEIVEDPASARPVVGAMEAMAALAAAVGVHVALVSGRGLDDLRALSGAPVGVHLIGSHGAEFGAGVPGGGAMPEIDGTLASRVRGALEAIVATDAGLYLETKAAGFALHTRRAVSRARADRAVAMAIEGPASLGGVRTKRGKEVIELTLTDASKGKALTAVRSALGVSRALFVGDDVTDEEGFLAMEPGDVTVKVGEGDTAARFRVAGTRVVVAMLEFIAASRR